METLAWVAATSVFGTGILVGLQLIVDHIRNQRLHTLELVPNCLLTRYPIVFVTGRRSLFYFKNYWNQVPNFLAEHGYEVEVMELPWRNRKARFAAMQALLTKRSRPCHLIADSSQTNELQELAKLGLATVMSITVTQAKSRIERLGVNDLRPRNDGIQVLEMPQTKQISLKGLFLGLHNFISGSNPVYSDQIGATSSAGTYLTERKFLEYAISLAERDAR